MKNVFKKQYLQYKLFFTTTNANKKWSFRFNQVGLVLTEIIISGIIGMRIELITDIQKGLNE